MGSYCSSLALRWRCGYGRMVIVFGECLNVIFEAILSNICGSLMRSVFTYPYPSCDTVIQYYQIILLPFIDMLNSSPFSVVS